MEDQTLEDRSFDDDAPFLELDQPETADEVVEEISLDPAAQADAIEGAMVAEFGETKLLVDEALAQPGRGKKVIPITFSHYCPDGAKDPDERTYGVTSWKKAENKEGEATCEHAVLGLVVAGEQYGRSFKVCIARDKCRTHFADVVRDKEKAAKLRENGKPKQAAKVEKKAEESQNAKWKREQDERLARDKAWSAIEKPITKDALEQVKNVKALNAAQGKALLDQGGELGTREIKEHLGAQWFKSPAAALLISAVTYFNFTSYNTKESGFDQFVKQIAKPFGLNVKRLEAIRDKHQPKKDAAAPAKKAS